MSVTSRVYSVSPALLRRVKKDNELLGFLFGDEESDDAAWKVPSFSFVDFEDTHRLLRIAGYPTLGRTLDFGNGNDDAWDYNGYDIQIATPAKVKTIAKELAKVTLEELRTKGLESEFRTDRRSELLQADDYDAQFRDVEKTRAFFAEAAKKGNAIIASAA